MSGFFNINNARVDQALTPIISIVIPVKNGEATIEVCLQGILKQTLADKIEIILIDSGSTDATVEIASKFPVQIHAISPEKFNHGATRNLGAQIAKGEFVVMTVQDAVPANESWLQFMLRHFDDPAVAGVCGSQIVPHDADKNPIQWFRPVDKNPQAKKIHYEDTCAFASLSPEQQYALCRWDDVNAMYRRSALMETPFRRVSFAEDALWAKDALLKGYALVYEPNSWVNHYHYETFVFRFKRTYTILYHTYFNFNCESGAQPLLKSLLRCIYLLSKEKSIPLLQKGNWIVYNARLGLSSWLATRIFQFSKVFGDRGVDIFHTYLCKKPPHAIKPVRHGSSMK